MDRYECIFFKRRHAVYRRTEDIESPSKTLAAYRYPERTTGRDNLHSPFQSLRKPKRYAFDGGIADVVMDFKDNLRSIRLLYNKGIMNIRKIFFKLNLYNISMNGSYNSFHKLIVSQKK